MKKKISEWILPITGMIIASIIVSIFMAMASYFNKFEGTMTALQIQVVKNEKETGENYNLSRENRKIADVRYNNTILKIGSLNVSIAKLEGHQLHILKELEKISDIIHKIFSYGKIVNLK
jgi:hypothetical protein